MLLKKSRPPKKAIAPIKTAICIEAFLNVGLIVDINPIHISGSPIKAGIMEVKDELSAIYEIEKAQTTINKP